MILSSNLSVSPLTGKEYSIPEVLNDQKNINDFISKNKNKKVVVVQGLGFVGAVMSLVVANGLTEEYAVIGIDLPRPYTFWKIQSINEGAFPVVAEDPKIEQFYKVARNKGNLYATYDPYCYSLADIVIVDINLDVAKDSDDQKILKGFDVDLSAFKKAMEAIGQNCKPDVHVLVETTVPPGTCQKIVKPIIDKAISDRGLKPNFTLGHSYERVMPGPNYVDSIRNFYRVYSGIDQKSADVTEQFLKTIITTEEYPLTRLGNTNATEMAKVLENSFRAMNISFIVEWSRFAEEAGVNLYEVVNAIRMRPTHKNIMLPGLGVGGYCLTKDPLLASWSKQQLFESDESLGQSEKGVMINDQMPYYAFRFIKKHFADSLKDKKVLLLGVSYLNDVGDTRYTPVELLYNCLKAEGAIPSLHDPYVSYWEEKDLKVSSDIDKLLESNYDLIIISTGHKKYRNNKPLLEKIFSKEKLFFCDTIGILKEDEIKFLKQKHNVKVLGRGDI